MKSKRVSVRRISGDDCPARPALLRPGEVMPSSVITTPTKGGHAMSAERNVGTRRCQPRRGRSGPTDVRATRPVRPGAVAALAFLVGLSCASGPKRRRAKRTRKGPPAPTAPAPAQKEPPETRPATGPVAEETDRPPVRVELAPEKPERKPAAPAPLPSARELELKEPEEAFVLDPRRPERDRWEWNRAQAEVTPEGDLTWSPRPFRFEPGPSVRYIDFASGSDSNSGTGRGSSWKHHPWDPNATGNAKRCRGTHTYVFKRGVVYRGSLRAKESGEAGEPIRLTSDPDWGRGEAVISGSERVTRWRKSAPPGVRPNGGRRGASRKDIPEPGKVWYADLDFAPRCVWVVDRDEITRLALARTPNWKVSDPDDVMSEWWTWENPRWWTGEHKTKGKKGEVHLGIDTKHLTRPADHYVGGIVWSEWGIVMGTPFPSAIEVYDPAQKAVGFQGFWYGTSGKIIRNNRYFLEDRPHYLDEPGEFWFEKKGGGGRLYVRLPGDRDPNRAAIEAGRRYNLIDSDGMSHVHITGLTFRFTNVFWDLTARFFVHKDVDCACIRALGTVEDVLVSHCRFEHVNKAVRIKAAADSDQVDRIVIADNEILHTDHGAIQVADSSRWAKFDPPFGPLGDVSVLRNRLYSIGLRAIRSESSHALCVTFPETAEVAGNVLDRCYGAGIFVHGGKGSGQLRDRPLCRMLVYGNKATNTLLAANDWGGIETWQGGPTYVYNNISGNANGYWNWAYRPDSKPASARLGFAYYLDGGFKNYHFNNVAWGVSNDLRSRKCSNCAFYNAVPTTHNTFFNNTAYMFATGSSWSPAGGRHLYLGNLWHDISLSVFTHGKQKEDKDAVYKDYPLDTIAYGRNVFHNVPQEFGFLEGSGTGRTDLEGFKRVASERGLLASDVGEVVPSSPVRDAAKHDFRLRPGSAAIDHGAKVFVPWGIYATVGEWNFRRNNADPSVLLDDHWYMTPYYVNREDYRRAPVYSLKAVNVTADDYVEGPLEDWTHGALAFDGKNQYASLSHEAMTRPYSYKAKVNKQDRTLTASGDELATPDVHTGNLLIEAYFRTEPGHAGSVLVSKTGARRASDILAAGAARSRAPGRAAVGMKMSEAGYRFAVNRAGGVTLTLRSGRDAVGSTTLSARPGKAEVSAGARINDGEWHHVIAEVDRATGRGTIYVDGKKAAEEALSLPEGASLSNAGDLLVGRGADGHYFAGAVDFLRIARGTLADAKTSIEELYDWQFDGPFLRDFQGRAVTGERRDAGAFERAAD